LTDLALLLLFTVTSCGALLWGCAAGLCSRQHRDGGHSGLHARVAPGAHAVLRVSPLPACLVLDSVLESCTRCETPGREQREALAVCQGGGDEAADVFPPTACRPREEKQGLLPGAFAFCPENSFQKVPPGHQVRPASLKADWILLTAFGPYSAAMHRIRFRRCHPFPRTLVAPARIPPLAQVVAAHSVERAHSRRLVAVQTTRR
jgi:hypothetical protein